MELARRAVLSYATYRAVLLHEHSTYISRGLAAEALPQFARDAVRGHTRLSRLTSWQAEANGLRGSPLQDAIEADAEEEFD